MRPLLCCVIFNDFQIFWSNYNLVLTLTYVLMDNFLYLFLLLFWYLGLGGLLLPLESTTLNHEKSKIKNRELCFHSKTVLLVILVFFLLFCISLFPSLPDQCIALFLYQSNEKDFLWIKPTTLLVNLKEKIHFSCLMDNISSFIALLCLRICIYLHLKYNMVHYKFNIF